MPADGDAAAAPSRPSSPLPAPSLGEVARRPTVLLFLAVTFLTEVGMTAQLTALGKRVFDISGREADLGLVGLGEFLPVALLVLVAGAVADRLSRTRITSVSLLVQAAFSVALISQVVRPDASIGPVFALVVGYATARAFMSPAFRALPVTIVEPLALPRINSLFIGTFQAGVICGPVVGGLLYTIDVWVPFAVAAGCLAMGGILVLGVRLHPAHLERVRPAAVPGGRLAEAFQGLRVIRREPLLLGAISLDLFAVLFGGAVALLPAIAEERLGVGVVGLGWLRAAAGLGAGATTLLLAFRPVTRRVGRTLFAAVGVFGAATVALGLTRTYAVAFAALVVLSAADSVSVFIRVTLVPLVTPDEVRGRVGAVENVFIGASNELGAFESGTVGQLIGAGPAVVLGGAVTMAIVVVWPLLFPAIRRLDGFPFHHSSTTGDPPATRTVDGPGEPG